MHFLPSPAQKMTALSAGPKMTKKTLQYHFGIHFVTNSLFQANKLLALHLRIFQKYFIDVNGGLILFIYWCAQQSFFSLNRDESSSFYVAWGVLNVISKCLGSGSETSRSCVQLLECDKNVRYKFHIYAMSSRWIVLGFSCASVTNMLYGCEEGNFF